MKRITCFTIVVTLAALAISRSTPASTGKGGREVPRFIIDTDMDTDDAAAIAYMCQEHLLGHVRLLGVTITNNGAGLPGKAIKHARCLLRQCGLPDLPVADANLPAPNVFPDDIRNRVNGTLENVFAGCQESEAPSAIEAPKLLGRLARSNGGGKVVLLATGPLSNIAQALHDPGALRDHVGAMFVMGGAVHVGGNLCCGVPATFDNSQEFNFWIDPAAVSAVFQQLRPGTITLIPLDATNFVPRLKSFDQVLEANPRTGAARFVAALVVDPGSAVSVSGGFLFWWDPLAAVAATTDGIVRYVSDRITVVPSGPRQGALVTDPAGAVLRIGIFADRQKFQKVFLERLNALPHPCN